MLLRQKALPSRNICSWPASILKPRQQVNSPILPLFCPVRLAMNFSISVRSVCSINPLKHRHRKEFYNLACFLQNWTSTRCRFPMGAPSRQPYLKVAFLPLSFNKTKLLCRSLGSCLQCEPVLPTWPQHALMSMNYRQVRQVHPFMARQKDRQLINKLK